MNMKPGLAKLIQLKKNCLSFKLEVIFVIGSGKINSLCICVVRQFPPSASEAAIVFWHKGFNWA